MTEEEKKIEQLEGTVEDYKSDLKNAMDKLQETESDLDGARNDKKALYDLIIDLTDEITRDINDRVSEVREAAKAYVK